MSAAWEADDSGLRVADITGKRAYKFEAHHFVTRKRLPYLLCKHCGLVSFRNPLTAWAERVGCNANDHPEYAARCRASRRAA